MRNLIAATVVALSAACGSLVAPAGPFAGTPPPPLAGELTAVEGRPAGVVLRLRTEAGAARAALYRVEGAGTPQLLQEIEVDERARAALAAGIEVVDSTVSVGATFAYQLALLDAGGAVVGRSPVVSVRWDEPPGRPREITVHAPFPDAVEVAWSAPADVGAIVFRRDVLTPGARFERVATVRSPEGLFVDRDVRAGGVWSYRVAFARWAPSGFVQIGPPSEEAYASTPEAR